MAFIVTDFIEYKSYGNRLNEYFVFHLAILKGVARMGKYFSVSIEALAPKQPCHVYESTNKDFNFRVGCGNYIIPGAHDNRSGQLHIRQSSKLLAHV